MTETRYIDFSGARPGASSIKRNGAAGVLRYLSAPVPATKWKLASKAEIATYLDAGLDVILNYEWYEGRCNEGKAAGVADAKYALAQAQAIGYPAGACIYFSHDTGTNNNDAILAYFEGVHSVLDGHYEVGVYSGITICEFLLARKLVTKTWQTIAWSNGQVGPATNLFQNGKSWYSGGADEDVVLHAPLGGWRDHATVKPVSAPTKVVHKAKAVVHRVVTKPGATHTVRVVSGDSLSAIATRNDTTVAALVALNKGRYPSLVSNPNLIRIGWTLVVSGRAAKAAPKPKARTTYYRVVSGDTLSGIAARYRTSVPQLMRWNPIIKNANLIQAGWTLRVSS